METWILTTLKGWYTQFLGIRWWEPCVSCVSDITTSLDLILVKHGSRRYQTPTLPEKNLIKYTQIIKQIYIYIYMDKL